MRRQWCASAAEHLWNLWGDGIDPHAIGAEVLRVWSVETQDRCGSAVDGWANRTGPWADRWSRAGQLPITSSQKSHLWDALRIAYTVLGLELATKGDNVFRDLVLARIIEPTSKVDASRVLTEVGVDAASYATIKRPLPIYARRSSPPLSAE